MTTECYQSDCRFHFCNSGNPHDEGPFCDEPECRYTEHLELTIKEYEEEMGIYFDKEIGLKESIKNLIEIAKDYNSFRTCPNCGNTFRN